MELKLTPPGVQHTEESRRIGAAELRVARERLDRLGDG